MPKIDELCSHCGNEITAVFNPVSGSRDVELISGHYTVNERCFVADEIHFTGDGRLVFAPLENNYLQEYFVVCRKLVIRGGRDPGGFHPCAPDDPGSMYSSNNAITWRDRLTRAADGPPPSPEQAPNGTSYDRNAWTNQGQGNHGINGGDGANGGTGEKAGPGRDAPNFTLLALEVDIGAGDHLTIDFDGQNGGSGGIGQRGGDGGDGMGGRDGESDNVWPGKGCDRQPGHGGDGGNAGNGGRGGRGGAGGNAGAITIISTAANVAGSGPFLSSHIHYVHDGGDGGDGRKGGTGGRPGRGGRAGRKTLQCDEASDGNTGAPGDPDAVAAALPPWKGPGGANGTLGKLDLETLGTGTCADVIPLPPLAVTSVTPSEGTQDSLVDVTIQGTGFDVTSLIQQVSVSGMGVNVNNVTVVNTTTITCQFEIGPLAPATVRDVTVRLGPQEATLADSFKVTS